MISLAALAFMLASCDTWNVQPQPIPAWTAIPSRTPGIVTATPIIIPPTQAIAWTATNTLETFTLTPIFAPTDTPSPTSIQITDTPSSTFTVVPLQSVTVDILGCNTSIDILHGMGEVTNAYVTVKNTGSVDLPNTCALLRAVDEGREHPDKKHCVNNLPAQYQVTFKLTVDSTYKQDTIIQVDASSNDVVLLRVDQQSCRDISLFGGEPLDVGGIKPLK
jgi:hypothetical protein